MTTALSFEVRLDPEEVISYSPPRRREAREERDEQHPPQTHCMR
jgi:hypothetical protein